MYYGKMTEELEELYKLYEEKFDCEPDFYEEFQYGDGSYDAYVHDIRWALETGKEIPELYPDYKAIAKEHGLLKPRGKRLSDLNIEDVLNGKL